MAFCPQLDEVIDRNVQELGNLLKNTVVRWLSECGYERAEQIEDYGTPFHGWGV